MKRIGIKDVAKHANVSISTVSMALNHPTTVSAGIRERVTVAVDDLGYVPMQAAQQLRAQRSGLLGMTVINMANPFFADMLAGAEDAATAAGLRVLVGNTDDDAGKEGEYLELFDRLRVEGALIAPFATPTEWLTRLRSRGVPVVLIDSVDELGRWPSVSFDNVAGGRMAAEHLIDLGRRHLAFVGARDDVQQVRERLKGVREAVADRTTAQSPVRLDVTSKERTGTHDGRAIGEQLAVMPPGERPDAVIASNDTLACGVVHALVHAGVRVPEDIAVVGYDDIAFASIATVPLTTIRQPAREMGRTAGDLLLSHIQSPNAHSAPQKSVIFAPELIVRASTIGF